MKKLFLSAIFFCSCAILFSQTLFTYGTHAVTKDEFLRAYNKNKTVVTDKEKALREYLDLYIKFKLKVQAAKDIRLDTLSSLATDLQNFRSQIEEGYLNDENQLNTLMQEASDRSQKDIHVLYLFYPIKDFSDSLAVVRSHLTSKEIWGDFGFITVFNLPYDIENFIYGLKPGQESKPYRTKNGFYIFKNVEERKAVGKIKAAQILIAVPEGAKEEDKINAKRLADSVYRAIQSGADFGEMAKNMSNDKMTYMSGGVMPEFGTGKYDPAFENNVFALKKDNDITPPFQTQFGYHIVKRLSRTEISIDKNDAAFLYNLKQQVQQDSRITSAKEKFLNDVLKRLNYKKNAAVNETELWKLTDSFIVTGKKIPGKNLDEKTILFSVNNTNIKTGDWLKFAKEYKSSASYKGEADKELFKNFTSITVMDNFRKKLPDFNPDFKYQLQEFKDGNMLFEIMERNVWTKASNDSVELNKYYTAHKNKYTWNASADAVLISCTNEKVAVDAASQMKNGKEWKQITEANPSQIQTDSGRYEITQIVVKQPVRFSPGMVTEPLVNTDGTASFAKIVKVYPANMQRSFEEARGLVINDYQNFLEEKWVAQLKKKYPVKVNENVFKSLL
jgi:peptidyl-prolyl cis-trans isomerase SurA